MKALVTGAAGFIGSNLCALLLDEGWEVIALDNLMSGYRQNILRAPGYSFVEGDIRDTEVVRRSVSGCEVIFHLAASVGNKRSLDNPVLDAEINLIGTIRVLDAARAAGVRKIVVSSSAGIFGELKTLPIAEEHPTDPDTPYGVSKLAAEKVALAYHRLWGIEVVCLRYFNVYGRNQRFDAYGATKHAISARSSGIPAPVSADVVKIAGCAAACVLKAARTWSCIRASSAGFNLSDLVNTT
jgi:UDP-glucose 4-epimerase